MLDKLLRLLSGPAAGGHCRRCKEPLHPGDQLGATESVCLPCRLDPGRATLPA